MDAIFRIDGQNIETSHHAAGPWHPTMQHGSPPSALVAHLAEAMPSPVPMQVARVTVDLLRPVPVAPLTYETEVLREGRKIQLCAVRLKAQGVVVVRGTVLKTRVAETELPDDIDHPPIDVPPPDACPPLEAGFSNAFVRTMSLRKVYGGFGSLGPGATWYRADLPLIEGKPMSPVMRAVVAADFSNATSAVLDFRHWTFINADLNVFFARAPVGDWILLNSEMWLGPDGAGIAASKLGDQHGYFGRAIQNLVIEKR
ncbi:thioesterase family protein [Rhodopseudomonas sp. B29]|uniref:thioesterase family protein n=1 Tax=Rhodopseudomonas sp. B29 TaxID=95607 RepID=UPI000344F5C6|nr:thioesterase family protein [Rhodopseudomonas sp. B29]